jgi:hypothetical protein
LDIHGVLVTVEKAINTTQLGNSTGFIAALWGFIRVTTPIIQEWSASRKSKSNTLAENEDDAPTYKKAFEISANQSIKDHEAWDDERKKYEKEIDALHEEIEKDHHEK